MHLLTYSYLNRLHGCRTQNEQSTKQADSKERRKRRKNRRTLAKRHCLPTASQFPRSELVAAWNRKIAHFPTKNSQISNYSFQFHNNNNNNNNNNDDDDDDDDDTNITIIIIARLRFNAWLNFKVTSFTSV